jgi:hypothetical protein
MKTGVYDPGLHVLTNSVAGSHQLLDGTIMNVPEAVP